MPRVSQLELCSQPPHLGSLPNPHPRPHPHTYTKYKTVLFLLTLHCYFNLLIMKVKVLLAQSCLTLHDTVDCSPPGSSVHGILQARILEWVAIPSSRDLPNTGVKPRSPTLQADSLPSEPPPWLTPDLRRKLIQPTLNFVLSLFCGPQIT